MPKLPATSPPVYIPVDSPANASRSTRAHGQNTEEEKQKNEKELDKDEIHRGPTAGPSSGGARPPVNPGLGALPSSSAKLSKQDKDQLKKALREQQGLAVSYFHDGDARAGAELLLASVVSAEKNHIDLKNTIYPCVTYCLVWGELNLAKELHQHLISGPFYDAAILSCAAHSKDVDSFTDGIKQAVKLREVKIYHAEADIRFTKALNWCSSAVKIALEEKDPIFFVKAIVQDFFFPDDADKLRAVANQRPDHFLAELIGVVSSRLNQTNKKSKMPSRFTLPFYSRVSQQATEFAYGVEDANALRASFYGKYPETLARNALDKGKIKLAQALMMEKSSSEDENLLIDLRDSNLPSYDDFEFASDQGIGADKSGQT